MAKVELIDYTGKGFLDPYYAARLLCYAKATRLEQGAETLQMFLNKPKEEIDNELAYIANTIRSSWEFVDYTFQITGVTRGFTHQFVRSRHASFAQQTQRIVDMSDFRYRLPDGHAEAKSDEPRNTYHDAMMAAKVAYRSAIANGVSMQDARGILPTDVQTNIIAKFNLRSFVDLLGKRKSIRAQGEYNVIAAAMEMEVLSVHPWAEVFTNPKRTETPALDALFRMLAGDRAVAENKALNDAVKEVEKLKGLWG
jgi:flavin-dependent thymidylate synthase